MSRSSSSSSGTINPNRFNPARTVKAVSSDEAAEGNTVPPEGTSGLSDERQPLSSTQRGTNHHHSLSSSTASSSNKDVEKADNPANAFVDIGHPRPSEPPSSFQVSFDGDDDPTSPLTFSTARKWLLVLIVSSTSFCVTCTSSVYTMTYAQLTAEFGCSEIVATLGLSLFVIGLGIGPMLLSPLSEVSL